MSQQRTDTSEAFGEGMQFGARIEHGEAVAAIATAALLVLGKDQADGVIDLGALGRWYMDGRSATKEGA